MNVRMLLSLAVLSLSSCTLASSADSPFSDSSSPAPEDETSSSGGEGPGDKPQPKPEPEANAVEAVCQRIDACGFLPAGYRVRDCEDSTRMCLEDGLQSEVADWELGVGTCLELQNCFNFLDCYESLQTCEVDLEVETTGFASSSSGEPVVDPTLDDGTTGGDPPGEDESSTGAPDPTSDDSGAGSGVEPPICEGTCDACLDCALSDPCDVEAAACSANPDCLDLNDCYLDCNDADCYDVCDIIYPGGVADHAALTECAFEICTGSC